MDPLRTIAEAAGYFTRHEAFAVGHDDRSIGRTLRLHVWRRVRPGAYTFPDLWPEDPVAQHQLVGRAVARKFGRHVARSHTTAALEHGLLTFDVDLSRSHVTRLDGGSGRTEAGVVHHEGLLLPADVQDAVDGPVTTPVRAALETASLTSAEGALVVLDSVLHQAKATERDLADTHALVQRWPHALPLQVLVPLADGRAASVGESRARYLCYAHQLPAPVLQYDVNDDTGLLIGTTDFAWPEHRLFGEFDGRVKYGRYLRVGEQPGDAVFREKRREDRLCEQLGWRMVRIVWSDLSEPHATAARIRRMLQLAA